MKLASKILSLLLLIVAFKFSFDAWGSGSLIQSFGTFFVGFVALTVFMALTMDDAHEDRVNA
ncbi:MULTISPECIES: hypothetical protein [Bacillus]|uniref:hypothetical protein n=1 Tax=Bacillus TaxID=1386 RepID=UPI00030F2F39|nr:MULTISPECIES: hypothetical protein [Bacillus]